MKIYIISKVRGATNLFRQRLELHTEKLEQAGHEVYLPHRDTDQNGSGLQICEDNAKAMDEADEIHLFYSPDSQGTHFDLGFCFAKKKTVRLITCPFDPDTKGFPAMLREYAQGSE